MRLSKIIDTGIRKASKGKDTTTEVKAVLKAVKGAVKAYKGSFSDEFEKNKDIKVTTVMGCVTIAVLDDESLLTLIRKEHRQVVAETCTEDGNENYELNAELARGIATNSTILAACYWLGNENAGSGLL